MKANLRGKWALITGASSGLGVDFARELAMRGANLVLVARREERLRELALRMQHDYGVQTEVLGLDLGKPDAAQTLFAHTRARGLDITVLVNNAGFGLYGHERDLEWTRVREMLELDILTVVQLARLYAVDMATRGEGYVLNVASVAGTQPAPTFAAYAAAKGFVISYSHALREELSGSGVSCTVLAPGATATEFFDVSGAEETLYIRLVKMQSPAVVKAGVEGMLRRAPMVIPGILNRLSVWGMNLLPLHWVARIVHIVMKSRTPALPSETSNQLGA